MSAPRPHPRAAGWQRVENALIAAAIILTLVVTAQPWWLPFAAFLAFDLSALGYLVSERAGALTYNIVHSYTGPALAAIAWGGAHLEGAEGHWLILLSASWGFHVALDRSLGFGLKLGAFSQTHLGVIGAAGRDSARVTT